MARTLAILMYGRDAALLDTRRMVMERDGFLVQTFIEFAAGEKLITDQSFDLFVLCHSLSLDECSRALELVRNHHPHIETLVLAAGRGGCISEQVDSILSTLDGPAKLITTIKKIAAVRDQLVC